jgi:hypothetical protein
MPLRSNKNKYLTYSRMTSSLERLRNTLSKKSSIAGTAICTVLSYSSNKANAVIPHEKQRTGWMAWFFKRASWPARASWCVARASSALVFCSCLPTANPMKLNIQYSICTIDTVFSFLDKRSYMVQHAIAAYIFKYKYFLWVSYNSFCTIYLQFYFRM